ncbi:TetR/AcrR family transcriptional regulator [Cellulomonas sp. ATA003]|uniref:TetR/AcrR family transcriptional regulator n=1 Tax=Cellulomonas sp. ATA003 TaxID=3073064 RepID=UPI002873765A|nr:TetR/AcrR family transcriptional regulator [Cellulomonas sp. ATA003]WNB84939.1 TetR/AcrR family transcriptional regulator [Cellulomonas sp. ATA003]
MTPPDLLDEPMGLRERQKRARREALIDAAHRLVDRDGLDGVTVEAICADAGVSTRTFFNYFESKDDAVLGMAPLRLDPEVAEAFATGGPTGVLATDLESLARSILASPLLDRGRMAAAAELARREPRLLVRHVTWLEQYRVELEGLLGRRLVGDSRHLVEVAGMTLMILVRAAMQRWESAGGQGEVADHLTAVNADLRLLLGAGPEPADPAG